MSRVLRIVNVSQRNQDDAEWRIEIIKIIVRMVVDRSR